MASWVRIPPPPPFHKHLMSEQVRIFSYLPNPRVWKSMIAAKIGKVNLKIIGDKPKNLSNWLWDFDAKEIDSLQLDELKIF